MTESRCGNQVADSVPIGDGERVVTVVDIVDKDRLEVEDLIPEDRRLANRDADPLDISLRRARFKDRQRAVAEQADGGASVIAIQERMVSKGAVWRRSPRAARNARATGCVALRMSGTNADSNAPSHSSIADAACAPKRPPFRLLPSAVCASSTVRPPSS